MITRTGKVRVYKHEKLRCLRVVRDNPGTRWSGGEYFWAAQRLYTDGLLSRPLAAGGYCITPAGERFLAENGEAANLPKNELDFLRSYENGPRVWDATALLPGVHALQAKGLIEPVNAGGYLYQLTETGRRALTEQGPVDVR